MKQVRYLTLEEAAAELNITEKSLITYVYSHRIVAHCRDPWRFDIREIRSYQRGYRKAKRMHRISFMVDYHTYKSFMADEATNRRLLRKFAEIQWSPRDDEPAE